MYCYLFQLVPEGETGAGPLLCPKRSDMRTACRGGGGQAREAARDRQLVGGGRRENADGDGGRERADGEGAKKW